MLRNAVGIPVLQGGEDVKQLPTLESEILPNLATIGVYLGELDHVSFNFGSKPFFCRRSL